MARWEHYLWIAGLGFTAVWLAWNLRNALHRKKQAIVSATAIAVTGTWLGYYTLTVEFQWQGHICQSILRLSNGESIQRPVIGTIYRVHVDSLNLDRVYEETTKQLVVTNIIAIAFCFCSFTAMLGLHLAGYK